MPQTPRKGQDETYQDKSPDDVFIKVYPARLRTLIHNAQLTRTEIAELVLIALRIDGDNTCFQSKATAARDSGLKQRFWTKKLHKRLKEKGVIDFSIDKDRSPIYKLPDAFEYGLSKSKRFHDSDPGGDRNSDPGGDRNSIHSGSMTLIPKQNQYKQNQNQEEPTQAANSNFTKSEEGGSDWQTSTDQQQAANDMIGIGVQKREATLISQQFDLTTIYKHLTTAQRKFTAGEVRNPGAWFRKSIELETGQRIRYPNSKTENSKASPPQPPPPPSPGKPGEPIGFEQLGLGNYDDYMERMIAKMRMNAPADLDDTQEYIPYAEAGDK